MKSILVALIIVRSIRDQTFSTIETLLKMVKEETDKRPSNVPQEKDAPKEGWTNWAISAVTSNTTTNNPQGQQPVGNFIANFLEANISDHSNSREDISSPSTSKFSETRACSSD